MGYKLQNKITLYTITNLVNDKIYIGVTENFPRRINQHNLKLKNGNHRSNAMQFDYNKCGRESFVFDIVSEFVNKIEASRIEKYYTDILLNMNQDVLYNKYSGGVPYFTFGCNIKPSENALNAVRKYRKTAIISEATRKKMSMALKGRVFKKETLLKFKETCHRSRKVINVENGKIYNSLTDATMDYKFNVKYATLVTWLNIPKRNKTTLKWLQ